MRDSEEKKAEVQEPEADAKVPAPDQPAPGQPAPGQPVPDTPAVDTPAPEMPVLDVPGLSKSGKDRLGIDRAGKKGKNKRVPRNFDKAGVDRKKRIALLLVLAVLFLGALGFAANKFLPSFGKQRGVVMVPILEDGVSVPELDAREAYPEGPLPQGLLFDYLLVEKGRRRMTAYAGDKEVRVYLVALGQNSKGHKEEEGDKRTPEGEYLIDDKTTQSSYYKNLGISYPNEEDRLRAEKSGVSPGGNIKVHGLAPDSAHLGPAHRLTDWTHGCIAVTNEEMDEIYEHTPVGILIKIVP
ncbi:L,D-transpeptidase family protein [Desulfovibrio sp. OttesenSCG-928-G15]|nr:L,D-transpeptidase family protein [Desulfovibrio sp. OttesenSCG-928-G15]